MRTEYTAEGFEQETIDERIELLLEAWGVDVDDDEMMHYESQRAYDLATSFPANIIADLFMQIMELRNYRA